jgi:hypothetical protein
MKISEMKLLDLLPECMRNDRIIKGFSNAWDYAMGEVLKIKPLVNLFDNLELLSAEQLDQVADAMKIPWYNTEYEKDRKIALIRHYEKTCFKLGTKGSIYDVANDIYRHAEVEDWYEYEAPQWRFKIVADFGDYTTEEALSKLTRIVRDIKPAKATLNPVEFLVSVDWDTYTAAGASTRYDKELRPYYDTLDPIEPMYTAAGASTRYDSVIYDADIT